MRTLVINAGSSSVKFSVFDTASNVQIFKSELQRLESVEKAVEGIPALLEAAGITTLDAIGHRVAHGGSQLMDACVISDDVVAAVEDCISLAPLHNPPALAGISVARKNWPDVPQVAVFDTAFHQTIPERASTYAVPESWRNLGLRRYGFHGTSHKYVMLRVAEELGTPAAELRIISCHLGNGASVCAIERGVSVDTSMGMTALEGLVMGSRSGDVDPGMFAFLSRTLGLSPEEVELELYKNSGLAALSGAGNDMRDIEQRAGEGDKKAQLAISVYAYRARKYIAAYAGVMGGVDVIAFTGGIGENSVSMRKRICERFDYLGLIFDEDLNSAVKLTDSEAPQIQQKNSRVKVIVTQTREQWMIAQETSRVVRAAAMPPRHYPPIPVAVSAHHVHLTKETVEALFGKGYELKIHKSLTQKGQWAAEETVDVIGPRGEIKSVRILGPYRSANQIEVAETEAFHLGVDAPLRQSGQTQNTPVITLRGPAGTLQTDGIIVASRHIHTNPTDAAKFGFKDGDMVEVEVRNGARDLVFRDVLIRVNPEYTTEMHIDTDEANAAHIKHGGLGALIPVSTHVAQITSCPHGSNTDGSCKLAPVASAA
ncbi:MAG: acetate/propionate family kinase [Alphaproteobacteria bacterium]|nr:acetate/propionate family kinase [Alphaproteobacteria bacterium]